MAKVAGVEREGLDKIDGGNTEADADQTDATATDDTFGMTTPRKSSEPPVFNNKLGSYQRPMSAHGIRNQQDSTFSLTGKRCFGTGVSV